MSINLASYRLLGNEFFSRKWTLFQEIGSCPNDAVHLPLWTPFTNIRLIIQRVNDSNPINREFDTVIWGGGGWPETSSGLPCVLTRKKNNNKTTTTTTKIITVRYKILVDYTYAHMYVHFSFFVEYLILLCIINWIEREIGRAFMNETRSCEHVNTAQIDSDFLFLTGPVFFRCL